MNRIQNITLCLAFLMPFILQAQAPPFAGKPYLVEVSLFTTDPDEPYSLFVYRFDAEGRVTEQWLRNKHEKSGTKFYPAQSFYYADGRLQKTTMSGPGGGLTESVDFFYNAAGQMIRAEKRYAKPGSKKLQEMERDEKGRLVHQWNISVNPYEPMDIWRYEYPADSVQVQTEMDSLGQVKKTMTSRKNRFGDVVEAVGRNAQGDTLFEAYHQYTYDARGNWTGHITRYRNAGSRVGTDFKTDRWVRRIVYQSEPVVALTADNLTGSWVDFLQGFQLDVEPGGGYSISYLGKTTMHGKWALDTRKRTFSISCTEDSPKKQRLKYSFDGREWHLYWPKHQGVMHLVKLGN